MQMGISAFAGIRVLREATLVGALSAPKCDIHGRDPQSELTSTPVVCLAQRAAVLVGSSCNSGLEYRQRPEVALQHGTRVLAAHP
jgi:hypothetical protein